MPMQGDAEFDVADALGCDLLWADDLDASQRFESGTSLVAHDIFHRWMCPRGRLLDDVDYGFGLVAELLNRAHTPRDLAALPRRLEGEARKDARVLTIAVTLTQTAEYVFTIQARGTTAVGPFRLVAEVASAYQRILEAA